MYKQRYHIKLILLLSAGILCATLQAAQQPIRRDSKIDIPSNEVYRLPTNLQPSVSKIKKAITNDQDLYLVTQQLMLVGGSIEEKPTWKRRSCPPNTYAIRIVCTSVPGDKNWGYISASLNPLPSPLIRGTGGFSSPAQAVQLQNSSFEESTFGVFGQFVKENQNNMIKSGAFTLFVFGCSALVDRFGKALKK